MEGDRHFGLAYATGTFVSASPVLVAAAIGLLASCGMSWVSQQPSADYQAIFSGMFNLFAILSGFLGSFIIFVASRGNTFLEHIRETATYDVFFRLLVSTVLFAMIVLTMSFALTVWNPGVFFLWTWEHLLIWIWAFSASLVFVNFARSYDLFFITLRAEQKRR